MDNSVQQYEYEYDELEVNIDREINICDIEDKIKIHKTWAKMSRDMFLLIFISSAIFLTLMSIPLTDCHATTESVELAAFQCVDVPKSDCKHTIATTTSNGNINPMIHNNATYCIGNTTDILNYTVYKKLPIDTPQIIVLLCIIVFIGIILLGLASRLVYSLIMLHKYKKILAEFSNF